MEKEIKAELHVANRNGQWEVFFPDLEDALYIGDGEEDARVWAERLAGESGYEVVVAK